MKVIVAGAGKWGRHLAKLISHENDDCVLIDENEEKLEGLDAEYDIMTVCGSPTSIRVLEEVGAKDADMVIGVTADESVNMNCCILTKKMGAKKTLARVDNYEYVAPRLENFFREVGIDSIIYPELLASYDIIHGLKMSWARQRWDFYGGELVMLAIKMRESAQVLNVPFKDLCRPNDPYHIAAIKRNGEVIIPGGNDELFELDLAYFMTTREYIPYIRQIVGKEHYADVRNVIIMGGGKTAVRAVRDVPDYMRVKIIEQDLERCNRLNEILDKSNIMVIHADGRDMSLLVDEGLDNTQAFVALTGNAETNILSCLAAKKRGVRKTIAMVENADYASMAEDLDIGTIVNKMNITASHIYQKMLDTNVTGMRFINSIHSQVIEFEAAPNSKVTRMPVKDLGMPRGATIAGLGRGGKGMLVSGMTQIMAGDTVMVLCNGVNMKKLERMFR